MAMLYLGCGMVCVYLNEVGSLSTAQLGLVMLYAAQLQRAAMEHMMTLTQVETQVLFFCPLFFSDVFVYYTHTHTLSLSLSLIHS
jgi:hypothetical protein